MSEYLTPWERGDLLVLRTHYVRAHTDDGYPFTQLVVLDSENPRYRLLGTRVYDAEQQVLNAVEQADFDDQVAEQERVTPRPGTHWHRAVDVILHRADFLIAHGVPRFLVYDLNAQGTVDTYLALTPSLTD